MIYLLALILLLLSFLFSPLTISFANKLSIIDAANHRSSHKGITPSGGGIVFILTFWIGIITYSFLVTSLTLSLFIILVGSLIMAYIGWIDDSKELSAGIRFLIQIIVVLVSCIFIPKIWGFVPIVIEKIILILAWMWFINLFNFMDGTDGYATQEAVFICIGIFLLSISLSNIALILGASVLGFLRVNYPKAKIFMGDVGSIFLGYILGGLLIYSIAIDKINFIQPIILTSLFSFDATFTLIKRGLQKKKVWKAHREHWYQRLIIAGSNHKFLFWIGIIFNFIILSLILLFKLNYITISIELSLCIILFVIFILYIKFKENFSKNETE